MRLTEESIAELVCAAGQKDRLVFDDAVPGLAVRVSQSGAKAFLAQYTIAGQKRRVPIGRWGAVTLKQARNTAKGILGEVAGGADPAQERAAARAAAIAEKAEQKLTLDVLVDLWAELALAPRRESYRREACRAVRYAFEKDLKDPAARLSRERVIKVLDALAKAGKGAMAVRTQAYGRACFGWALRRGDVPANPFVDLPIRMSTVARDRVLTESEVRAAWVSMSSLGWPFGPLFQLLLLTAQRKDEVGGMRWSEISADGAIWTVPKERAKNGRAHIVHLAPAAQDILRAIPRFDAPDLVFTTTGKTPVSGFSKAKERLDEKMLIAMEKAAAEAGEPKPTLPGWRLHDFRRTVVTWLAGTGYAPHVCDRLLNHVSGTISGVAAVYQRAEFLAERKAALEAWSTWLTAKTEPT